MIDSADQKTLDAFPAPRRGRPSTGNALSAADRKRDQRERARQTIWGSGIPDYSEIPTAMLIEAMSQAVSRGCPNIVTSLSRELVTRAKENEPAT